MQYLLSYNHFYIKRNSIIVFQNKTKIIMFSINLLLSIHLLYNAFFLNTCHFLTYSGYFTI